MAKNILSTVTATENLYSAWKEVKKKKGSPGVDGISVALFGSRLDYNLTALQRCLQNGDYSPLPLLKFYVAKQSGGKRPICIPAVVDRVAQRAFLRVVDPMVEPRLSDCSFAYRRGRSVKTAIQRILFYREQGYSYVVHTDIDDYFEHIDHDFLLEKLSGLIDCNEAIELVKAWLKVDFYEGGRLVKNPHKGLPQGAVISPLLANVYLDEFDKAFEQTDFKLVRFGDDFLILCKDKASTKLAFDMALEIIKRLSLKLSYEKTAIVHFGDGFKFLGATLPNRDYIGPDTKSNPGDMPQGKPTKSPILLRTLYLQEQGCILAKNDQRFVIKKKNDVLAEIPAIKVDQIIVLGNSSITTSAMKFALTKRIPIILLSKKGCYCGRIERGDSGNVELHQIQFNLLRDHDFCLRVSKKIVKAKIHNQRVLLQRHSKKIGNINQILDLMRNLLKKVETSNNVDQLRGLEGIASTHYFNGFKCLLKSSFGFKNRIKRPPVDPVNSLLSFGYTLLFQNVYAFITVHGLNPYIGYFHALRNRHPCLASDLIEEFRTPIIDSLVLYLVNSQILKDRDFYYVGKERRCLLIDSAQKTFIRHFEHKMNSEVTHYHTGILCSYRKCIDLQVQEMLKVIKGEQSVYRPLTMRY